MKTKFLTLAFSLVVLVSGNVFALERITGHVTSVESTYLPGTVVFWMDTGSTSCSAGKGITWQNSDASNNKIVYATLMTAVATGKKIDLFINDGDTKCVGQYLHFTNSN